MVCGIARWNLRRHRKCKYSRERNEYLTCSLSRHSHIPLTTIVSITKTPFDSRMGSNAMFESWWWLASWPRGRETMVSCWWINHQQKSGSFYPFFPSEIEPLHQIWSQFDTIGARARLGSGAVKIWALALGCVNSPPRSEGARIQYSRD